jgi:hypothetical protein
LSASRCLAPDSLALLVNRINCMEIAAGHDLEVDKGFTNQTASFKFRLPFSQRAVYTVPPPLAGHSVWSRSLPAVGSFTAKQRDGIRIKLTYS